MNGDEAPDSALHEKRFELFKFYEEASQRTKADAWTQTTWVLTLSGAILAFSVEAWLEHPARQGLATITWAAAVAGVILTGYIMYVQHQLATHIKNYWTAANRLAATDTFLRDYVSSKPAARALKDVYEAGYPRFILLLNLPPLFFAAGHVAWAIHVASQLPA